MPKQGSIAIITWTVLLASTLGLGQTKTTTAVKTGYAPVNGLKMYYEIHGAGDSLILLHGGLGAAEMFNPILPVLASGRQVIAVDLQAHGRTADIDRPMTIEGSRRCRRARELFEPGKS